MKLLLDEMWPPSVAEALRQRGRDAEAVAARPDLRGASDERLFAVGLAEGRAIVTENVKDFRTLATTAIRAGRDHPPLILTSSRAWPRANPGTIGRLIKALDALLTADDALEGERWLE